MVLLFIPKAILYIYLNGIITPEPPKRRRRKAYMKRHEPQQGFPTIQHEFFCGTWEKMCCLKHIGLLLFPFQLAIIFHLLPYPLEYFVCKLVFRKSFFRHTPSFGFWFLSMLLVLCSCTHAASTANLNQISCPHLLFLCFECFFLSIFFGYAVSRPTEHVDPRPLMLEQQQASSWRAASSSPAPSSSPVQR